MKLLNSSKLILIGYAFIALFLFVYIQLTKSHSLQIESHYTQLIASEQQTRLIQDMQLRAKNRSIILLRIAFEQDPFMQEELIQEMDIEGLRFGRSRSQLRDSNLTEAQRSFIDGMFPLTEDNRNRQQNVIDLILDEKINAAHQLLLETIPVQDKVIDTLGQLSKELYQGTLHKEALYQTLVEQSKFHNNVLLFSLLFSILLLGVYSFKQVRQYELLQQSKVQRLTKKMQDQAHENALDAHILRAVDQYIVLVDQHGQFIRTNPTMDNIINSSSFSDIHTIWQLLDESSNHQIKTNKAKESLQNDGEWRHEAFLLSPFECFALCEIQPFTSEDIPDASYLVTIKDITELKETQEAVELQANYDAVTELPNRHFFQKTLAELTQESHESLAVFYIDLDDFKNINDTLGHHFGDELLNAVSHRMYNVLLEEYLHQFHLARIGGDEFSIILTVDQQQLAQQAEQLANRLIEVVSQPYTILDHSLEIGCSIGIALFPLHGESSTKLMRHADLAMYEAKHSGKNQYIVFNSTIGQKLEQKLILKNRLEAALQHNEFVLHYQPQYDLKSNQLIGLEALIRWQSDEVCYSPAEFIPFAEQNGFIQLIDEYVIALACKQIDHWQNQGYQVPRVAINISSQQINSDSLLDLVNQQLSGLNLNGSQIELEITEYSLVESLQKADKQGNWLNELRAQDIHIAIDDFGTGYSSLSYLQHMPVNRLKIDRSFIQNITEEQDSRGIVESIISLGHNVNASVLAEGIETEEQYAMLVEMGCDEGQGYLMNRPLPADEIEKILLTASQKQAQA